MPSFDATNGTDTEAGVPLDDLTIISANANLGYPYQPTPEGVLTDAIAFLQIDASRYGFVDLGCGKGRTLITASRLGFSSVEGVEFAAELVDIARQNLTSVGMPNARVHLGDAAEYEFVGQNLVVYIFNSFAEPVLEAVLQNLVASGIENFYLIYRNPSDPDVLHDCSALRYLGSPPGRGGYGGIHVWERAAGASARATAPRPSRRAFRLFADLQLEPFTAVWTDVAPAPCFGLSVMVTYRRDAPIVKHALVCAFELASPPAPDLLREARLAQSKYFPAFDYLPEPKLVEGDTYSAELRVWFDREVTLTRFALARWSNAGPITIVACKLKLRATPEPPRP